MLLALTLLFAAATPGTGAPAPAPEAAPPGAPADAAPPPAYCSGEYADDFAALPARVRELEQRQAAYTFCIRTRATYECPFYDSDGTLRRTRKLASAHGTGFGYQVQNGETLVLTNQHVAEWPSVTDDEHRVDDVPSGCKRVSDSLRIVDNEADDYEADDIALTRLVSDPQLDMAVLKARTTLPVLPWRIGRSAGLRERNVVDVRGFPLGAFKATNVGKVVSAYDHDEYREWSHDDFVIDALLSQGNSGSPVLAMSCKTGEFELVGVYHAGYTRGSALNVVVGIEQIRDLMSTLKRSPRRDAQTAGDSPPRASLIDALRSAPSGYFPFGNATASALVRADGTVVFQVLNRDFPLRSHPVLVVENVPAAGPAAPSGGLGRVWFGNSLGLKRYGRADLDAEALGILTRALEALSRDALATATYQAADRQPASSRERHAQLGRLERSLKKAVASRQELGQQTFELADRLAPQGSEVPAPFAEVLSPEAPPAEPAAPAPTAAAARELGRTP